MIKNEMIQALEILEGAGLKFPKEISYDIWFAFFQKENHIKFKAAILEYIGKKSEFPTIADLKEIITEMKKPPAIKDFQLPQHAEITTEETERIRDGAKNRMEKIMGVIRKTKIKLLKVSNPVQIGRKVENSVDRDVG